MIGFIIGCVLIILGVSWLFFPDAPYLMTDSSTDGSIVPTALVALLIGVLLVFFRVRKVLMRLLFGDRGRRIQ
ncbi:hypothetical protein LCL97_00435 [Seohaeicola saemankumensis]|nr:hypothetical protein [Seohaeicola saemankumensis]MCA0869279.1 hypothetical protein [Seohaeicola saemankumensis]